MGAVDLGGGGKTAGGKRRVGFVLDMTPLVDIAFLLLTFFMFATTMAQPSLMEMRIPPDIDSPVPIEAEDVLTLFIAENDKLYYNVGLDTTMRTLEVDKVREFAITKNTEKKNELILAMKLHPQASYEQLVRVLDELNKAETVLTQQYPEELKIERKRKFSIQRLDSLDQIRLETI